LGVSDIAITALIVETPIGLLYIIARNLFPQRRMPGESRASAKVNLKDLSANHQLLLNLFSNCLS
jgi:hypothetical protein